MQANLAHDKHYQVNRRVQQHSTLMATKGRTTDPKIMVLSVGIQASNKSRPE
jgi:hypothetical protein